MSVLSQDPTSQELDQIAIVGMAGRFPGAQDVDTFWRRLKDGTEGIATLSEDELIDSGVRQAVIDSGDYVCAKGVLDDADQFDAEFFGFSAREAEILDPQHRIFLQCAWDALESAGCVPGNFDGRIGVFAGAALNTYLLNNLIANRRMFASVGMYQTLLASDKDFLATRAAYKLGLTGPAITVQSACSTSLTAVHLACQSLLNGECDIALAGGVSVSSPLKHGYVYEPGGIASPDGHCRPFDADAHGTVPGNGVGVVVLRRLSDARADGDQVDAVVLGTAINNDGSVKAGYTAPSVAGQSAVISEALAVAGVTADTIGYVETHGTGTALGDPIEIAALTRAYRADTAESGYCAIGSVKSNIGHLDAAAGVAALIKSVLMLKHRAMPPTLHFRSPNPELDLAASPFYVNAEYQAWPHGPTPRRIGVSSFGIGGTNVHLIVEEAPDQQYDRQDEETWLLPLSAKTREAATERARRLAEHLEQPPEEAEQTPLGDIAHTLASRRQAFGYRATVIARDRQEAAAALRRVGAADIGQAAEDAKVAFLFPGQGAQYPGMARGLYQHEPAFAEAFDACAVLFAPLGLDVRGLVFDAPDGDEAAAKTLERTELTQPVLFTVEYAIAKLLGSWGIKPAVMAGHSIGEYVAAALAGVFSLQDAVQLVAARGALVQAMPAGSMVSVFLPAADVLPWLDGDLSVAARNSTSLTAVSGPSDQVESLAARLRDAGISCRVLHTSHAFHSPTMDGAVEPLVGRFRQVSLTAPSIPFCSNVTGALITAEQATAPEYWGTQLRQPVRFADAAELLLRDPSLVIIEVGPGHTLTNFLQAHELWEASRTAVASLRHPQEDTDDRVVLLTALGALWRAGVELDWTARYGGGHRAARLPGYPFARHSYWVRPDETAPDGEFADVPAIQPARDWFYSSGWKRLPGLRHQPRSAVEASTTWVLLGGDLAIGRALASRLGTDGSTVISVVAAAVLAAEPGRPWSLDPANPEHFADLVRTLDAEQPAAIRFVHLFSLSGNPAGELDQTELTRATAAGFTSLMALARAVADASPAARVCVDVLCRGVRDVTGTEPLAPANATLTGVCTVMPQEIANLTCRTLDISETDPRDPAAAAVQAVLDVLASDGEPADLALRGRTWWYRDFDPVRLPGGPGGASRLRDGGVYLITGGLGGIGLSLAEHIAGQVREPVLALLGRSALPADQTSEQIARIEQLRRRGAQVRVISADVTDADQMDTCVAALRHDFGPLTGVIHAAGEPASGMIARTTPQDAARVLAAKTRGTLVLDQVCAGDDLDFLMLCSSVTGILGGPGQADYCAANAFLDSFSLAKRRSGSQVFSVAWPTWTGVGMAAGMDTRFGIERQGEPTGHPLLRRVGAGSSAMYATTLRTSDSWIVDDHRLMGQGLVPGTAYLELVRAALAEQAGDRVIELQDVLFIAPVIVPDGKPRTIYTTVEDEGERLSFTVRSRTGPGAPWQEHAIGWATFADRGAEVKRDLTEITANCRITEVLDGQAEISARANMDEYASGPLRFRYGPRWEVVRRIEIGDGQMMATLVLPDEFMTDLADYPLHPAMLDMAVGIFRLDVTYPYYLPLSYRSLRILHPLTGTVHCAIKITNPADVPDQTIGHDALPGLSTPDQTLSCDVELLDPDGRVLVQITGYSVKRINDLPPLIKQIEQAVAEAADATDDQGLDREPQVGVLLALTKGITQAGGQEAFGAMMSAGDLPADLVVSASDFAALRRLAVSITPDLVAREVGALAPVEGTHPRPDLDTPYVAPDTEEERVVAAVWREVLGVESVGVNDDFFALGGQSLAAVQIGTKIRHQLGVELQMKDFFAAPTVAGIAALIAGGAGAAPAADVIERIRRDEGDEELDGLDDLSDDEVEARLRELLADEAGTDDSAL